MKYSVLVSCIRAPSRFWNFLAASVLLLMLTTNAVAQESKPKLAVINTMGEVWARDLSKKDVGPGMKLIGPGLFGGPDAQFVVADNRGISVITKSGAVWPRLVSNDTIGPPQQLSGSLFGGSDAKYVLAQEGCGTILVINEK